MFINGMQRCNSDIIYKLFKVKDINKPNALIRYAFGCQDIHENLNLIKKKNYSTALNSKNNFKKFDVGSHCYSFFKTQSLFENVNSRRHIWGWLNSIFNRVDESRILDAGPDRACAEWLLRCGAGVKWVNSEKFVRDYNSLPIGGAKLHKIEEVDATDSAVMHIGFPYFKNCKHIRRMVFHRSSYLDDEALSHLHYVKKTLQELQISSCGNISREGLNHIKNLKKLEYLLLYDLPLIKDKEEVIRDFEHALPNCTIYFPYAQASERPEEEEAT